LKTRNYSAWQQMANLTTRSARFSTGQQAAVAIVVGSCVFLTTSEESENLSKEVGWTLKAERLRTFILMDEKEMMRAAARLRLENIDADFAGIPHLKWLEE
jgi:hypothetical protein